MATLPPLFSEASFEYQPLDKTQREIRLLRLSKVDADGALHFTPSTASLDEAPTYNALSYGWGREGARDYSFVNGTKFWVRPNLFHFLKTTEGSDWSECFVFIDAICINQLDIDERNSQVSLMRDVYSGAKEVVAWLGRKDDFQWPGNTYWSRLWVVQEFVPAPKLMIQIGHTKFEWTALKQVLNFSDDTISKAWGAAKRYRMRDLVMETPRFRQIPRSWRCKLRGNDNPNKRQSTRSLCALTTMCAQRVSRQKDTSNSYGTPLHKLITLLGTQDSHEPRDKIFGLLGIARTRLQADYNIPITALYLQVLIEGLYEIEACYSVGSGRAMGISEFRWLANQHSVSPSTQRCL